MGKTVVALKTTDSILDKPDLDSDGNSWAAVVCLLFEKVGQGSNEAWGILTQSYCSNYGTGQAPLEQNCQEKKNPKQMPLFGRTQ